MVASSLAEATFSFKMELVPAFQVFSLAPTASLPILPLLFLCYSSCNFPNSAVPPKEKAEFFSWTTVTYRSIAVLIMVIATLGFTILYFLFPDQGHAIRDKAESYVSSLWNKISGAGHPADNASGQLQQARFTMFDGTVRVKKANSNTWVVADYSLPLDKGDVVQTMAEGIAKVAFADGSTYSIQPDSLITIEENSTNASQQVQVGVRLQTGTFQLNTGDVASVQQVRIDNSTTTIGKDSALQASNDRRKGAPAVLVTKGLGTFEMAGEKQTLAPFERVSFNPESGEIRKEKEMAPPVLLSPANMMPLFVTAPGKPVDFTWTPVEGVKGYHVRLSRNPYFSSLEKEAHLGTTDWHVTGLPEGKYYWMVQSVANNGRESIESDKNGFTIIARGNEAVSLALELEPFIQHGHVIEVKGKTQQGARVMVNGEQVPIIGDDGSFNYFTPPLPAGESMITITAQNERGGVNTQTKRVVIQ